MKRPGLRLAIEINKRVRSDDEWFDEPDDLDRVETALRSVDDFDDPVAAAGTIAFRVTKAQGFTEGNKRTALLLPRWTLDNNGLDGAGSLILMIVSSPTCSFMQRPGAMLKPRCSGSSPTELDISQHLVLN